MLFRSEDHDRLSGKVGSRISSLERENARLKAALERSGFDGEALPGQQTPEMAELVEEVRQLREGQSLRDTMAEAMRAGEQEFAAFKSRFNEATWNALDPHISKYITDSKSRFENVTDPDEFRAITRSVLNEGLVLAVDARSQSATERQRKQAERLRSVKRRAVAAGTGSRRASAPPKPKSLQQLTDDQLDELMRQDGREGF